MTLGRKNKIFYEVTESDVIDEIISENGLSGSAESTSHTHNEIVQYQATDWDFIQCRAQINNMLCFVEDGTVNIKAPELSAGSVYTATYGDNIFSFEAEIDARSQYDTFEASAWINLKPIFLLKDQTDNFLKAGLVAFTVPKQFGENTLFADDHLWLRATIAEPFDTVSKFTNIHESL